MAATRQRSSSLASLLSLSSSLSSLSVYEVLNTAESEANGDDSTETLLQRARKRLETLKLDENRLSIQHPSNLILFQDSKIVDSYELLTAMLECAPSEYGQRYVASTIASCDETSALVDLSNTFLRYLLLPFKGNRSNADFPWSEVATPTFNSETSYGLDALDTNRDSSMTKLVRLRDGYQCLFTEVYHRTVAVPPGAKRGSLENCHIIKRAVGVFDPQKNKESLATWDILRHYIGWDEKRTQDVVNKLDTPVDGMLLHQSYHDAWECFAWTFKPVVDTDGIVIADTYDIEVIRPEDYPSDFVSKQSGLPINSRITFIDRGTEPAVQELIPKEDARFRTRPRPVPDPELIALHRALCRVLHMSGAAEVIDSIFRDLGEAGVEVPSRKIRTADELNMLISLSLRQTT